MRFGQRLGFTCPAELSHAYAGRLNTDRGYNYRT